MRILLLCVIGLVMVSDLSGETVNVWFGTRGSAIYRSTLDQESGKLSAPEVAADIASPGFVCLNKDNTLLYSLGKVSGSGDVAVFRIVDDSLKFLDSSECESGRGTHLSLSKDERTLMVAHYGAGKVTTFPVDSEGRIGEATQTIEHKGSSVNEERQSSPHPHWVGTSPDGKFAFVPDLGMDQVVIYKTDEANHKLVAHGAGTVPAGQGPRHMKFHPNGKWVYVINELGLTVTTFQYDADAGTLTEMQTIEALPRSEVKEVLTSGSEIRIHPTGKYVYAGIRGHDIVTVFAVDEASGKLSFVEREPIRGSWPRNFGIDPSGKWLLAAGAESNTISVFRIEPTGTLTFTRNVINVPKCICVEFGN